MPILVTDYTWTQTDTHITLVVPLKGKTLVPSAIYTSSTYIKANFPPFLFELDLLHSIDENESKAVIDGGILTFHLFKQKAGKWESLKCEIKDKSALKQRRDAAEKHMRENLKQIDEKRQLEKHERQREGVRQQMKSVYQKFVFHMVQCPRHATELYGLCQSLFCNFPISEFISVPQLIELFQLEEDERKKQRERQDRARASIDDHLQCGIKTEITSTQDQLKSSVPPVRQSGQIRVTFSHRPFKTPERETQKGEEEAWLARQAAARAAMASATKGSDDGIEHNSLWYIDKALNFFKTGDYESAINAYTSAITLDEKNGTIFSSRAAVHLRLQDYQACAADALKALSLLQPPCQANKQDRLKAHLRRAASLEALGDIQSACFDYRKALEICPNDGTIRDHLTRLASQSQD
eukprot:gene8635-10295_t